MSAKMISMLIAAQLQFNPHSIIMYQIYNLTSTSPSHCRSQSREVPIFAFDVWVTCIPMWSVDLKFTSCHFTTCYGYGLVYYVKLSLVQVSNKGLYSLNGSSTTSYRNNLVRWRSREIEFHNYRTALKFDRHLGNGAAEDFVKSQRDWKSLNANLAASRLHETVKRPSAKWIEALVSVDQFLNDSWTIQCLSKSLTFSLPFSIGLVSILYKWNGMSPWLMIFTTC